MANISNISLPREKCMRCGNESDILMSSHTLFDEVTGLCGHRFCKSCFRKENTNLNSSSPYTFTCPCCHILFYENMLSLKEAILFGEAVRIRNHMSSLLIVDDLVISTEERIYLKELNQSVINKLEKALLLNPTNFIYLLLLNFSCGFSHRLLIETNTSIDSFEFYRLKQFDYAFKLLDYPTIPENLSFLRSDWCSQLASVFSVYHNYPAALKYAKLAYEYCLRSSNHTKLSDYKASYLKARASFAELPPLRFAVGDEVEFLLEAGSEWKPGKIVELYYRERDFDIPFTAPYLIQHPGDNEGDPPVCAWVMADMSRCVRRPGVRSIEETRYQTRLNAKVAELDSVYSSDDFIQKVYSTLAQDHEFVEMLKSTWGIELSAYAIQIYRMFVMYRHPLIRTDTGYYLPSCEEVIAEIKAYFDPLYIPIPVSSDAAPSAVGIYTMYRDSLDIRAIILHIFLVNCSNKIVTSTKSTILLDDFDVQG